MTFPVEGGAATPDELATSKRAVADRAAEMERVRAAAGKWQAGLAGLIAITTGLTIPSLGDVIRALEDPYGLILAIGAVGGGIFGVAAAIAALHASGGVPKVQGTLQASTDHADAQAALRKLRLAIRLSIVALCLAGLVCLLSWFAPRTADAKTYQQVRTGTRSVCGQVDVKSVPGQLLITTADKHIEVVALTEVTSWQTVDRCPAS